MGFVTIVGDTFLQYIFLFVAQVYWPLLILYNELTLKELANRFYLMKSSADSHDIFYKY